MVGGVAVIRQAITSNVRRLDCDSRLYLRSLDVNIFNVVERVRSASWSAPAAAEDISVVCISSHSNHQVQVIDQRRAGEDGAGRVGPGQADLQRLGGIDYADVDLPFFARVRKQRLLVEVDGRRGGTDDF